MKAGEGRRDGCCMGWHGCPCESGAAATGLVGSRVREGSSSAYLGVGALALGGLDIHIGAWGSHLGVGVLQAANEGTIFAGSANKKLPKPDLGQAPGQPMLAQQRAHFIVSCCMFEAACASTGR